MDLVDALAQAVAGYPSLHFGLYFSQFEWFNPVYRADKANSFKTQDYVAEVSIPQMHEIVNRYKPHVVWSDGDWEAPYTYWNSTQFLAWLYNDSPVRDFVVVNDRWGSGCACHHGGFYTCSDRFNPHTLQKHKWENALTIDKYSWGFRREATIDQYLSIEDLVAQLVITVSCGGNMLMNVGPTHDGRIAPILQERLGQMGTWLRTNGEAIYNNPMGLSERYPQSQRLVHREHGDQLHLRHVPEVADRLQPSAAVHPTLGLHHADTAGLHWNSHVV